MRACVRTHVARVGHAAGAALTTTFSCGPSAAPLPHSRRPLPSAGSDWRAIPGAAVWVSEGSDGAVFCCNAGGAAFRLGPDRVNWQQLGGAGITHISVGDAQNVVALAGGLAFRHTPANNDWARMPGDGGFTRISISSGGGRIVALAAGGRALAFDGGAWQPLPAPALESIDVGEGSLVAAAMGSYEIFVMQLPSH